MHTRLDDKKLEIVFLIGGIIIFVILGAIVLLGLLSFDYTSNILNPAVNVAQAEVLFSGQLPDGHFYQFSRETINGVLTEKTQGIDTDYCTIYQGEDLSDVSAALATCQNDIHVSAAVEGWYTATSTPDTLIINTNYQQIYINGVKYSAN